MYSELAAILSKAEAGDAESRYQMGLARVTGDRGLRLDYAEAARWFWLAADQGHPAAMDGMARLMFEGLGVPRDVLGAVKLFKDAANLGNADALNMLGLIHESGTFVDRDARAARDCYRRAAELGHEEAAALLKFLEDRLELQDLAMAALAKGDLPAHERFSLEAAKIEAIRNFGLRADAGVRMLELTGDPGQALELVAEVLGGDLGPEIVPMGLNLLDDLAGRGVLQAVFWQGIVALGTEYGRHDPERAKRLLAEAAALGHPEAAEELRRLGG